MRRHQVGLDGEPEYPESLVEIELPDGRVPLGRPALEQLTAPDVVDEHVDVAVIGLDARGQGLYLVLLEMVDGSRDPDAAEARDEVGGLLDRLGAVVFRSSRSRGATRANDRCPRLAQSGCDATPSPPRRARDDGDTAPQCIPVRRPRHHPTVPGANGKHKRSRVVLACVVSIPVRSTPHPTLSPKGRGTRATQSSTGHRGLSYALPSGRRATAGRRGSWGRGAWLRARRRGTPSR